MQVHLWTCNFHILSMSESTATEQSAIEFLTTCIETASGPWAKRWKRFKFQPTEESCLFDAWYGQEDKCIGIQVKSSKFDDGGKWKMTTFQGCNHYPDGVLLIFVWFHRDGPLVWMQWSHHINTKNVTMRLGGKNDHHRVAADDVTKMLVQFLGSAKRKKFNMTSTEVESSFASSRQRLEYIGKQQLKSVFADAGRELTPPSSPQTPVDVILNDANHVDARVQLKTGTTDGSRMQGARTCMLQKNGGRDGFNYTKTNYNAADFDILIVLYMDKDQLVGYWEVSMETLVSLAIIPHQSKLTLYSEAQLHRH